MEAASRTLGPKERDKRATARCESPEAVGLPPLGRLPKTGTKSSNVRRGGSRKRGGTGPPLPPAGLARNRERASSRPYRVLEIGATRLMHACQQGDGARVLRLIEEEPETLGYRDRALRSALHYCMDGGTGAAIAAAAPELVDAPDAEGHTPLHLAVIAGDARLVAVLLANGADPNAKDSEGHGLLHWATVCGEVECARLVLAAGARPSSPDLRGGSPLHYAAQCCGGGGGIGGVGCTSARLSVPKRLGLEMLRILLEFGADVEARDEDGRQPILWAASAGSVEAVLALARAGGSAAGATDKDGLTALHCAASRGHASCVEALVNLCGCDPDHVDDNGCSALHYAATLGHADATGLLLKLGAEPNRRDRKGRTPALCAAAKGRLETLKILTEHGGSLEARTVRGTGLAHEAVLSGCTSLLEWLAKKRPSILDLATQDGKTPLHVAALNARLDVCQLLMKHGARPNAVMRTRKNGPMTPLDAALYRGHRDCAKLIQMHGGTSARRLEPRPPPPPRPPPDQAVFVTGASLARDISSDETPRGCRREEDSSQRQHRRRQRRQCVVRTRDKARQNRRESGSASGDEEEAEEDDDDDEDDNYAKEEITTIGGGEETSSRRRRRRRHHRHHRHRRGGGGDAVRADEYGDESWSEANEYSEEDERSADGGTIGKRCKKFPNRRREPSRSDDSLEVVVVVVKKSLEKTMERRRRRRRQQLHQSKEVTVVSDDTEAAVVPAAMTATATRLATEPKKNTQDSGSSQSEAVERVTVTALVHEGEAPPESPPDRASERDPTSGSSVSPSSPSSPAPPLDADGEREPELPEVKNLDTSSPVAVVATAVEALASSLVKKDAHESVPPMPDGSDREIEQAPSSVVQRKDSSERIEEESSVAVAIIDESHQRDETAAATESPRDVSESLDRPIGTSVEKLDSTKRSLDVEEKTEDEGRAIVAVIESPRWGDDDEGDEGDECDGDGTAADATADQDDERETEGADAPRVFRVLPSTSEEEETTPRLSRKRVEEEERESGLEERREKSTAVTGGGGIRKQRRDSAGRDSGIEPSPRVSSKIPTRTGPYRSYGGGSGDRGGVTNNDQQRRAPETITRDAQANLRRYHLERKIFFQLMELKRLQIRHGRANERVLVKRQVESFHKAGMSGPTLGVAKYDQPLTFGHFEAFLYEQLRRLQRRPVTPDFCTEAKQCTQKTHRCHHATSAYTSLPVYTSLSGSGGGGGSQREERRHLLLPKIETRARGRMTVRVTSGGEQQIGEKQITTSLLPVESVDRAKRYYVTFTVRGEHGSPSPPPPPPPLLVAGKEQPR